MVEEKYYQLGHHRITLHPLPTPGLILDIGGGGEGVIGLLMGNKVVAIDIRKEELADTVNESLKIVMDASELNFLDETFSLVTAYYAMMYMPLTVQKKVFQEIYRVLKPGGRFLLWDVHIPTRPETDLDIVIVSQTIQLPGKTIQTGYGCHWPEKELSLSHYISLGLAQGFSIINRKDEEGKIYLELMK